MDWSPSMAAAVPLFTMVYLKYMQGHGAFEKHHIIIITAVFLKKLFLSYVHWCSSCLYVWEMVSDLLELESQAVVSHYVGVDNWILVFSMNNKLLTNHLIPRLL